jgi:hypothetical protein
VTVAHKLEVVSIELSSDGSINGEVRFYEGQEEMWPTIKETIETLINFNDAE